MCHYTNQKKILVSLKVITQVITKQKPRFESEVAEGFQLQKCV